MANNLRVFNTNSEYQSADLVHPAVSYVIETDKVHYEPTTPPTPVFQGKWKATYQDSHVESAQCDSSSEIMTGEINPDNLVSVEIGDYCVTSLGTYALTNANSLTSCTIGSGVTEIGKYAFGYCMSLASIDIPNSVTSIVDYAFIYCNSLSSVTIGNGVTSIGSSVFKDCTSLTSVTIGSGITSIGEKAFFNCARLTSITVNATTPPTLGASVFVTTNKCPFYVPSESVDAYKSASGWSNYASRIQPIP